MTPLTRRGRSDDCIVVIGDTTAEEYDESDISHHFLDFLIRDTTSSS